MSYVAFIIKPQNAEAYVEKNTQKTLKPLSNHCFQAPNFERTVCFLGAIGYELCFFGEIECHIPIFIPANPNKKEKKREYNHF